MIKSADDYADKAEKLHDHSQVKLFAAKDKDAELKSVTDQLEGSSPSTTWLLNLIVDGVCTTDVNMWQCK